MAPSWVISKNTRMSWRSSIPNHAAKRYTIEIHSGVSQTEMAEAENGTVRDGRLVHPDEPGAFRRRDKDDPRRLSRRRRKCNRNRLRLWEKSDFMPRPDDIFQERLYCIQWITKESLDKGRQETFFAAVTDDDLARERKVEAIVRDKSRPLAGRGPCA